MLQKSQLPSKGNVEVKFFVCVFPKPFLGSIREYNLLLFDGKLLNFVTKLEKIQFSRGWS